MMDKTTLEGLFQQAIKREVEAGAFYRDVAERVQNPAVKKIFQSLSEEEQKHEEMLWRYHSDPSFYMKFKAPQDYKVAETVELPELKADMKPADALALAMKKEQQAAEFYQSLATMSTEEDLKNIYEELAKMELGHKHRLENLYVDVGYPEVW